MIHQVEEITADALIGKVEALKKDGYRFVTMTTTDLDEENVDILYHFDKDLKLINLRLTAKKAEPMPSLTPVYLAAFLVENEIRDQFGMTFDGLAIDFGGTLYMEESVRPNPLCRFTVIQEKPEAAAEKGA